MTSPIEPSFTSTLALVGVGLLQALGLYLQRRNHKKVNAVSAKQDKIYELVNHPMGVAMGNLATALETIAHFSNNPQDIQSAKDARGKSDEHNIRQSISDAKELRSIKGTPAEKICLVVDDNASDQEILVNAINDSSWSADVANSSEMAIGLAKNRTYPIAFIDMRFPAMPGEVLFKALRKTNPDMRIIIVLGEIADLQKLEAGTYFGCIVKPPTPEAVRLALKI